MFDACFAVVVGAVVLLLFAALAYSKRASLAAPMPTQHKFDGLNDAIDLDHLLRGHGGPEACAVCGYDLTGNTSGRCPECGTRHGGIAPGDR